MDPRSSRIALLALAALAVAGACDPVPIDDQRLDKRLFVPHGVIRGAVTYSGPRPCSENGHIVGSAVVLLFDANNPPPPEGLANTAVNFVVVPGDVLFANEVRSSLPQPFCPDDGTTLTVTAPFTLAPLDAGQYVIGAFYDRTGRFLPTFKFRNLPEQGDLAGGDVDVNDAQAHATDPNYSPKFVPITVGQPVTDAMGVTSLVIPDQGFLADNVPVSIGAPLTYARPYFYPDGADKPGDTSMTPENPNADPAFTPVVTMTQDYAVLAPPPSLINLAAIDALQKSFKSIVLRTGVPQAETMAASDPMGPFGFPFTPSPPGLLVWSMNKPLPENAALASLWPLVVLAKMTDDPSHTIDPQSLLPQGGPTAPIVVIQGITLNEDAFLSTLSAGVPAGPTAAKAKKDHVTVLVRPSVLCIDARAPNLGGTLVTPHLTGKSSDSTIAGDQPLFDPDMLKAANPLIRDIKQGCLPLGRYEINAVYPTGQAWTVPNEAGSCAPLEGSVVTNPGVGSCASKPRPVLYSQGTRAVLEIVPPTTTEGEALCQMFKVPPECLPAP